jgi:hypothetical protein
MSAAPGAVTPGSGGRDPDPAAPVLMPGRPPVATVEPAAGRAERPATTAGAPADVVTPGVELPGPVGAAGAGSDPQAITVPRTPTMPRMPSHFAGSFSCRPCRSCSRRVSELQLVTWFLMRVPSPSGAASKHTCVAGPACSGSHSRRYYNVKIPLETQAPLQTKTNIVLVLEADAFGRLDYVKSHQRTFSPRSAGACPNG